MQLSDARPAASITFSPSPAQNQRLDYGNQSNRYDHDENMSY